MNQKRKYGLRDVNGAGYDVVTMLNEVINSFDDIMSIDRLQTFHLDDSKNDFGSCKDRLLTSLILQLPTG